MTVVDGAAGVSGITWSPRCSSGPSVMARGQPGAITRVFGHGGTSAAIASVLYNWGTGPVADAMGYAPVFVVAGILGPLGLLATVMRVGRVAPVPVDRLK
jgi:hypothetical protein